MTSHEVAPRGPAARLLTLADGRTLAWYEFGDPAGTPCLYVPGTPESGLAGACFDTTAREAAVRWISVDKPGYGHSDPVPGRRLSDWPRDATALVDHLGLDRFALAGEPGGGPMPSPSPSPIRTASRSWRCSPRRGCRWRRASR